MIEPHPDEAALNDHADGLLSDEACLRVSEHLERCASCRRANDELRSLLARAAELHELPPARDLLPGIRAAALDRGGGRWAWAAIAASLLAVAVAALALIGRDGSGGASGLPGNRSTTAALPPATSSDPELVEAERQFVEAARKLLEVIEQRRDVLPPEALADFERELGALDRAIRDTREVLAEAPERSNGQTLAALYQKKMELLWTVSRLTS
jgi:hypothetical protein